MASVIPISEDLQLSEEISETLSVMMDQNRVQSPKLSIPQILAAKTRPGLSSEILSSNIISRFPEIGIPTGPLGENTPNVMEQLIVIIAEEIVEAIQTDMRIDLVVDQGIVLQANGGNAGGPVIAVGATLSPGTGIGIAR